jgi:hypothetical protein
LSVSAAVRAKCLPVSTEPVSPIMSTSGWLISAWPVGAPGPVTTLSTPLGRISAVSSASLRVVIGVVSAGFRTTVLPAAIAGASFQMAIISG